MLKRINTLLGSLWRQLGPKAAGRRAFVSDLLRFPVRREAETLVDAVPQVSLEQLMEMFGSARLVLAPGGRERHSWGLPALESSALLVLLEALSPSRVFEIGTFDGGTTALLAERTPDYCEVLTLDLPDSDFEATQFPPDFDSSKIGHLHRESHGAAKVRQLRGNSLTFDYSDWHGTIDLVFVDAGHNWESGVADTRAALRLVRPGGLIVWDDFHPYWSGLVRAIVATASGLTLTRIRGTRLVFARMPV